VKQICVKGEADLPILPLWNIEELRSSLIDFRYLNTVGFGANSCSESSIKIAGNAKVSHDQKEHSRQSGDAEKCQNLREAGAPNSKFSEACERTRRQAKTLDLVEFKVEYNNVPEQVKKVESKLTQLVKFALWPFLKSEQKTRAHEQSDSTLCRLQFHRHTPSFDLTISRPDEEIFFSKVQILSSFRTKTIRGKFFPRVLNQKILSK
jgi:hypothetical protein